MRCPAISAVRCSPTSRCAQLIAERIGVTVQLAFMAIVFAIVVAVPLGMLAAVRANTWIDRGSARRLPCSARRSRISGSA